MAPADPDQALWGQHHKLIEIDAVEPGGISGLNHLLKIGPTIGSLRAFIGIKVSNPVMMSRRENLACSAAVHSN